MLSILATAALLMVQQPPAADTVPAPLPERTVSSAYADPTARELVRRAREYRRTVDRSVRSYRALARERSSAGLRTLRRERLLGGSELAARIDWRREGPVRVQLLGARERSLDDEDDGPEDFRDEARRLAFDPADDRMRASLLGTTWIRHPLAEGSERDYRFRSGDTLTVRLSGGESVRVYELRVEPRRADAPLVSGSIWLEDRSYGVVRTLVRLSQSLREQIRTETSRDSTGRRNVNVGARVGGDDDEEDDDGEGRRRRGGRMALLPDVRVDVRYITTEYGLVHGKWWMPTEMAVDATITAGSLATVPVRFERAYSQYQVEGDPTPLPGAPAPVASDTPQACRDNEECQCARGVCRVVEVDLPADSTTLATAAELPPPLTPDAPLMSGKEADELADEVREVAATPWNFFPRPRITQAPVLLRYNRVEALSVGTRYGADFGPFSVDGTVRVATADWEPSVELGIQRESPERRLRLAAYRRLAAADEAAQPFGLGNSLGALLFGRDNGDYFRATGVELRGAPPRSERPWLEWRLFAEAQRGVGAETDFSAADLFGETDFRPNIAADRADQAGLAFTWRPLFDRELAGMRWGADVYGEGQTGTFDFARPALTLRTGFPLGGLVGALEAAAGTSFGDVPVQGLWRMGGSPTVRGYEASVLAGTAFWRGRGEIGTGSGSMRFALFSDVGWAGDRDAWSFDAPLWSAGVGVSFLEGVVRLDLARALREPRGWGLSLSLDAPL
ncbi:MAG TPA: hypothetical protein VFR81_14390 [Longimicrobium sp.]|nr:hypothetical protein [Longimicrobium sp.]